MSYTQNMTSEKRLELINNAKKLGHGSRGQQRDERQGMWRVQERDGWMKEYMNGLKKEKHYILKNEGEKTNASENISNKKESCHIIYAYVIAAHL